MHALHCSYSRSVSPSSLRNKQPHLSNICHKQTVADADTSLQPARQDGGSLSGWKTTLGFFGLRGAFVFYYLLYVLQNQTLQQLSLQRSTALVSVMLLTLQFTADVDWVSGVWLGLAYLHLSASAPVFRRGPAGFPVTDVMVTSVILQTQPVARRRQLRAQFGLKM